MAKKFTLINGAARARRRRRGTPGRKVVVLAVEEEVGPWVPADTVGLISVWDPSQDQDGQQFTDTYGSNHGQLGSDPGADANDPTWVASPPSLDFDGNDYVDCGGNSDGSFADLTSEITIALTFYWEPQANNYRYLLSKSTGIGATTLQYGMRVYTFNNAFAIGSLARVDGVLVVNEDPGFETASGWHTFIWTFKSGANEIYLDGVSQRTHTHAGTLASVDAAKLMLGCWTSSSPAVFHEKGMGATTLYAAWRTDSEVAAVHNDIRTQFPDYGLPEAV